MVLDVGINVIEANGRSTPTIEAAPTSVAAFLGVTERGVPNRPVRISSPEQFRNRFGRHGTNGYLAYAIAGFFGNGGREAHVNRIVASTTTATSWVLNDRQITPAPTLQVTAGYRGQVDPGIWGNRLRLDIRAETDSFRLIVRYQATPSESFTVVEDWSGLTMEVNSPNYAVTRLNNAFTGSNYIVLTNLNSSATGLQRQPAVVSNLAPGTLATETVPSANDYIGDSTTGFHGFDTVQVQLLAIPDAHTLVDGLGADAGRETVVQSALDYCAQRGDLMFVGTVPHRQPNELESNYLSRIQTYSSQFQSSKVYGALYGPWIEVNDPVGNGPAPTRYSPADGHIMGIYARTERERGIWKAPAGLAAQVRGGLSVAAEFTDRQHTSLVRDGLVNSIRFTAGSGITLTASRTLSTDTRWWFVNVRLLFNFVKTSLRDGLHFVRQEPHTADLRRNVQLNVVRPFLLGLWRQGAFGSEDPDTVFSIKCDAENNPPTEVNLGNFRIEVYFYAARPVETIRLIVGQQPSGASANEL
ncbi:tail protein [Leptolyngbya sp. Heron Island J]|uniref:phage tail sheath subtilisin-like domain-containing protein n=1 Tax=Leptolyngbya sp. Heron Island J TaxID=1385935 RepID=UPI0003B9507D|nr:phage tail sheath subtilisin-like domain-containing protein [Leptolyngbya sp. Heron Island J]ESA38292.1 tail protein [Leptolyngbya sp. Heron Island J]